MPVCPNARDALILASNLACFAQARMSALPWNVKKLIKLVNTSCDLVLESEIEHLYAVLSVGTHIVYQCFGTKIQY